MMRRGEGNIRSRRKIGKKSLHQMFWSPFPHEYQFLIKSFSFHEFLIV